MHPTIFVIFGITGDLASRKLLPALLSFFSRKLLPSRFAIVGFSRRSFTREEFREYIRGNMRVRPGQFKEEDIKHFLDNIAYEQGMFDDPLAYSRLETRFKETDGAWGHCSNKLFHLSVPPTLYETILKQIYSCGLSVPCADDTGWTRLLIEKPFGDDLATAKSLDNMLGKLFEEKQIFRIDHYLAKETLQNILTFRFANSMFEPLWNKQYIEQVHIKLFERSGIEGRGAFYDRLGALKDVGQNHILQMLALICMEPPKSFSFGDIRKERARALSALKAMSHKNTVRQVVRAQYSGYTNENGVSPHSTTETYFRLETYVDSPRWKGIPFYLESGKAMSETKTEIDIYFKNNKKNAESDTGNILTFKIQPDEGIKIHFFVKKPGYQFVIEPKTLRFKYADTVSFVSAPNDYEKLIHDAFAGDQTLFTSTDEIMASWRFVTSIIENWHNIPLKKYERGAKEI